WQQPAAPAPDPAAPQQWQQPAQGQWAQQPPPGAWQQPTQQTAGAWPQQPGQPAPGWQQPAGASGGWQQAAQQGQWPQQPGQWPQQQPGQPAQPGQWPQQQPRQTWPQQTSTAAGWQQPGAAGAWQQPGTATQGMAQQGGAWQQPGAPQPWQQAGWTAGGAVVTTWEVPAEPKPRRYQRSLLVVLAGLALLFLGLSLVSLGGAIVAGARTVDLAALVRDAGAGALDLEIAADVTDVAQGFGIALLVVGIVQALTGLLVLAHRKLGRLLGVLFGLVGAFGGGGIAVVVAGLVGGRDAITLEVGEVTLVVSPDAAATQAIGGSAVIAGIYLVILLALLVGGRHFRRA
ncbi:MAG: hypothetical protein ACKOTZ_00475, partial [Chloroflexota bacterium]